MTNSVLKPLLLISLLAGYTTRTFAQNSSVNPAKPPLDTTTFDQWLSVRPTWVDAKAAISNNGKYALYKLRENWRTPPTVVMQAIDGNWTIELVDVDNAVFTEDSRTAVFIKSNDSLCLLTLGSSSTRCIPGGTKFKLFKRGRVEWLAYLLSTTTAKELILRNLETEKEQSFPDVSEYLLSRDGNTLILKGESGKDSTRTHSLRWTTLSSGKSNVIWEGGNASNLVLDDQGSRLAFRVDDTLNGQPERSVWYYKAGTARAIQLASNQSAGIDQELRLDGISRFSEDGSRLFVRLTEKDVSKPKPDAVKVDVWSYADATLQSQQLNELRSPRSYRAVIHVNDRRIMRLQRPTESVWVWTDKLGSDWVLIDAREGESSEWNWNPIAQPSFFLMHTSTGERKEVAISDPLASLEGKYIIGIGRDRADIYSYDIATGIIRNITGSLPIPVGSVEYDEPGIAKSRGLWADEAVVNGEAIIVYDEYDIWQIDPSGRKPSVNLTNGYGRKNGIQFRLTGMYSGKTIPNQGPVIVRALSRNNKNSGFYRIIMGKQGDPQLLSMGPYHYEPGYRGATQIKARDAKVYVVMRESATESPNYFWTKDFKTFARLSSVQPEESYNWLTSELVSFTTLDGRGEHAVLYKPENFDPKKKYPVIIHYYDRKSQELNQYHRPAEPNGELDIPWFVSHGYIVVTPDIHYTIGETGQSALNSVVGVARHISKFPWIDSTRMGLQGHSFGGYQTNYIVTQTNLFAAAVSSSGMSDIVSNYLGFLSAHTNHDWYENRLLRIGVTLWERPDLYIKNSPVIHADRVTTPILTVANKRDSNVPFEQGLEWFIALRRLGKRVWMLQYDEGGHGVGGKDYKDFVIRMTQFFDHYLKGAPAPKWMTQGVPARLKGIETGLELDEPGKTPGPGLSAPRTSRARSGSAF